MLLVMFLFLVGCEEVNGSADYQEKYYKELSNVQLIETETKYCYRGSCNGWAKFKVGDNILAVTIYGDDFQLLVKDSHYDIVYNSKDKELISYDIPTEATK